MEWVELLPLNRDYNTINLIVPTKRIGKNQIESIKQKYQQYYFLIYAFTNKAMASISTLTSRGKRATSIVLRAGDVFVKYSP